MREREREREREGVGRRKKGVKETVNLISQEILYSTPCLFTLNENCLFLRNVLFYSFIGYCIHFSKDVCFCLVSLFIVGYLRAKISLKKNSSSSIQSIAGEGKGNLYLSQSECNSATGIRTRLLRCYSPERHLVSLTQSLRYSNLLYIYMLCFDLLTRPKMPFKVMHRKEVTHSKGS